MCIYIRSKCKNTLTLFKLSEEECCVMIIATCFIVEKKTYSQLFNCLPVGIRNITGKSVNYFKRYLDNYLKSIPDQPSIPCYH